MKAINHDFIVINPPLILFSVFLTPLTIVMWVALFLADDVVLAAGFFELCHLAEAQFDADVARAGC